MKKITSTSELKNAILVLEEKRSLQGKLLKTQFQTIHQGLRPASLIKSQFNRLKSSTDFKIGITAAAVTLTAIYFAKKAMLRTTQHPLKRLITGLIGSGVTNLIAQHPNEIKSIGQILLHSVFNKKKSNPEKV